MTHDSVRPRPATPVQHAARPRVASLRVREGVDTLATSHTPPATEDVERLVRRGQLLLFALYAEAFGGAILVAIDAPFVAVWVLAGVSLLTLDACARISHPEAAKARSRQYLVEPTNGSREWSVVVGLTAAWSCWIAKSANCGSITLYRAAGADGPETA